MTSGGIFGPKLSGKTTLAKALSAQYWLRFRLRSLVLDINGENWGPHALVIHNESEFWPKVWQSRGGLVIVEEASTTIARNQELIPLFTRLRHSGHKLLVVGHSGMNLLPAMRQELDTLYLFRQPEDAAKMWARTFANPRLIEAGNLNQYEFLFMRSYGQPSRCRLKISP